MRYLLAFIVLWSSAYADLSTFDPPPNIATNYSGWRSWQSARQAEFEANCPLERTTTYYVDATDGDDEDDGQSEDTAFQTWDKAVEVINASGGDVRVRLKCGEVWTETVDGTVTVDNVTIDSYDAGEKPLLNHYSIQYLEASNSWTLASGNRYTLSEANDIAFLRLQNDRLGLTHHLARLESSASVESTPDSFYYDPSGDVLHVNISGVDPNTVDLEAVISNTDHGVAFEGDGCRVQGLRADGHGAHRTTGATQKQPFTNLSNNDEANLFIDCEGYWSSTHAMAHHGGGGSGSGGRSMWIRCKGGYASAPVGSSGTCSMFNSFSAGGGQETWFIDCEAVYGAARSARWLYATNKVEGVAFLWHTSGSEIGLVVAEGCTVKSDGPTQCQVTTDPGNVVAFDLDSFEDCRSFEVNCDYEEPASAANVANAIVYGAYTVHYGSRYRWRPLGGGNRVMSVTSTSNSYFLNCELGFNMTDFGNNNLWMTQSSTAYDLHYLHCFIKLSSWSTTSGTVRFRVIGGTGTTLTDASPSTYAPTSRWINSVLSINGSNNTARYLGVNNADDPNLFANNAYWNVRPASSNDLAHGKDNDPAPQELAAEPAFGTSYPELLENGTSIITLSHDINGKRRTVETPDIGPVDFSSPTFRPYIIQGRGIQTGIGIGIGI